MASFIARCIVIILASALWTSSFATTQWKALETGLDYTTIPLSAMTDGANGTLHAFRVDLSRYQLNIALAGELNQSAAFVSALVRQHHALLGINGGFFAPNMTPLGLRISRNNILHPIKKITWWGILFIKSNRASIVSPLNYVPSQNITFAVQSGPRLLVNGKIPPLKDNVSQRSALAIDNQGRVIIMVTEDALLSTTSLAKIIQRSESDNGLACKNALNLDGGSSSQLYADVNDFSLSIPSLRGVADAILVEAKNVK